MRWTDNIKKDVRNCKEQGRLEEICTRNKGRTIKKRPMLEANEMKVATKKNSWQNKNE